MDCDLIREKINILKCWSGSPDSADKAFLSGVAKDLEMMLKKEEEKTTVSHGKWIESWEDIRCSRCGHAALYYSQQDMQCKSHFCPYCGARMDLK